MLPGAERMAAEVSRLSGAREAVRYLRFRRQLELLLEAEWAPFVARDFRHLSDLIQVRAVIRLARLGALRRMNGLAAHYLTDWRLIRAHTFQALYVGLDPARAPGIYSIVSTMDTIGGVHIPARGGMHAVPLALADVAAKAGAQLRYGTRAERVLAGTSGVTGVRLAGGELLPASERDRGRLTCPPRSGACCRRARRTGGCAARTSHRPAWSPTSALDHQLPGQAHHTLHLGPDWAGTFDALTRRGDVQPGPDPSLLVTAPSHDPDAAPAGHATLSVLEPTANLLGGHDWAATTPRLRSPAAGPAGPAGLRRSGSRGGRADRGPSRLGGARAHRRHAVRPGSPSLADRVAAPAPLGPAGSGLHFAGAGTAPGIGVPMVLISGRLAARAVLDGSPMTELSEAPQEQRRAARVAGAARSSPAVRTQVRRTSRNEAQASGPGRATRVSPGARPAAPGRPP